MAAGAEGHAGHGTKAVVAALLANLGIAIAKFVGFVLTRSVSMLAESVHSVADTGNQALLLLGGRRARKPPTPQHPFGYGRERYFWSFVVALMLFSLGGMFATYEGIQKIRDPHELESTEIALAILVIAIVLESLSFRTAVREARRVKEPGTGWWLYIRRSKQPELPVVLLEDLGALVGLVFAFSAVVTAHVTGDAVWDGYGTLAIGILLIVIAAILAVEMKGLLIGEAATEADQQRIAAAIEVEPSVVNLLHMRTEHIGPDELLVGAKLELVDGLSMAEVAEVVNRIESSVRRAVPKARIMYLEPDVFRSTAPEPSGPAPPPAQSATEPSPAAPPAPPATEPSAPASTASPVVPPGASASASTGEPASGAEADPGASPPVTAEPATTVEHGESGGG